MDNGLTKEQADEAITHLAARLRVWHDPLLPLG
jgi:hypothetical protein